LGGLENVLGSALGLQECGEGGGELNWVGEGVTEVYSQRGWSPVVLVVETEELEVGRAGVQEDEAEGSRASTSRGDAAGKQLRGGEARARRCTACGRAGPESVILIGTLLPSISTLFWFLQNSSKI